MRAMIYAALAMIAISIGSYLLLGNAGFSSAERTAGPAVRLDNCSAGTAHERNLGRNYVCLWVDHLA